MTDEAKIALFRRFEETVWKLADESEKGMHKINVKAINKAEEEYMLVAKEILAVLLNREPTGREVSIATMY
jgi:hypothetical protein